MSETLHVPGSLPRSEMIERVADIITRHGVAVISQAISLEQASSVRTEVRRLLIPSTPLRAVRFGTEKLLGRESTPDFLQRRPIEIQRNHTRFLFSPSTEQLLNDIDGINVELLNTDPLRSKFNDQTHNIAKVVLNRFAPREEFEAHQDSVENTGLTFVIQTSPTSWRIHPEGPRLGEPELNFTTADGDIVVLSQSTDGTQETTRHAGFSDYREDGSVVHSGLNLTDRNRFTLALFSRTA